MTHQFDVARGRDIVARWCALAEQRLEYLTELFETGRWRRFHSELAFLENIQEAKAAVEIWRDLLTREASRDNPAVDISWLGRAEATLPRGEGCAIRFIGWPAAAGARYRPNRRHRYFDRPGSRSRSVRRKRLPRRRWTMASTTFAKRDARHAPR